MKFKSLISSIAIASLGFSSLAFAQPSRVEARQDAREAQRDMHDAQRDLREARTPGQAREARQDIREAQRDLRDARNEQRDARDYYNARGPEFRRGGHLPPRLRDRQYVVNDWRGHRLAAPPRGYQWVQVGPDFVLVAAVTGVIAQIVLAR